MHAGQFCSGCSIGGEQSSLLHAGQGPYPALCLDILMVRDAGIRQKTVGDSVILVLRMVTS